MTIYETIRSWFVPTAVGYYDLYNTENAQFVSPEQAMSHPPIHRAVSLIANDIARTPFESSLGLLDRPNAYFSGYEMWRTLMHSVLLTGNGFILINRNNANRPAELINIDPNRIQLRNGKYDTKDFGTVEPEDMIHIKFGSCRGVWGESPIALCQKAIQLANEQEKSILQNTLNGGGTQLVVTSQARLNADARRDLSDEFRRNHAGSANAGKPWVLGEDMKVNTINTGGVNDSVNASRSYSLADVARIYGVPVSLLQGDVSSTYGNIEAFGRMYFDGCLSHWFKQITEEVRLKLGIDLVWDTDLFTKPPLAELMSALRTGIEASILTPNEARDYLNLAPIEGGDEVLQALNMGKGGGSTNLGIDTSGATAEGDNNGKATP